MFNVYDKESARKAYEAITMFSALNDNVVKGMVADLKRNARKWANEPSNVDRYFDYDIERRIVKDDGIDGMVELVTLPDGIDNEEHADKFFHAHLYIEPVYSMYDCTGRAFTSWYKLFNRHGRFMAYHRVSFDV